VETVHSFHTHAIWSGSRASVGQLESAGFSTQFSVPTELNGPGIGTNPEELLIGAAAGCYLITLSALLTNRKIPYQRLDLKTTVDILRDGGMRVDKIEHRPTITVDDLSMEEEIMRLALHAEHTCMVSSALRGNVKMQVLPKVQMQALT